MAVAFVVAKLWLPKGRVEAAEEGVEPAAVAA